MSSPKVSLVVPCRNGAETLAAALDSCAAQDYPNLEILFVDNDSDDGSADLARELAIRLKLNLRVMVCKEHGLNHARNHGFDRADGDFLCLLDVDDLLLPGKLRHQVDALQKNPAFDFAYGDWCWRYHATAPIADLGKLSQAFWNAAYGERDWVSVEGNPMLAERHFRLVQYDDYLLRLLQNYWSPPHSYLVRSAAAKRLQAIRAFHPGRPIATDREYFSIAALLGYRFIHVPGSEVVYSAWSGQQMTRKVDGAVRQTALHEIHQRLLRIAQDGGLDLSAEHRLLMEQPRMVFKLRQQALRLRAGENGGVLSAPNGHTTELDALDVACFCGLVRIGGSYTLEHFASQLAFVDPILWERHSAIMKSLIRFVGAGLLLGC